jgi:dynein heavy chain 1
MRQLVEHKGFWRTSDLQWVKLERIQIVGACNPPTMEGRVPITSRLLRHCPVLLVDFPGTESLKQIYGTFCRALLKLAPRIRGSAASLTDALVDSYDELRHKFTSDHQKHYIYSPRELSRWMRALYNALKDVEISTVEALVKLYVHEGLRLFQDRLVTAEERETCDQILDEMAYRHFPTADRKCLSRPLLYSNWLSKDYVSVDREEFRTFVQARMKVFNEEELNVPIVVFDEVIDHVLRIDRVLNQPIGHALLIGASGSGKTVLSRFVAWMNGISTFMIKIHKNYQDKDFDEDLRQVMKRAGCKNEKICFIFDESNVLSTAWMERLNALLASGEVPGLFEGEEEASLMMQCKEAAGREGLMLDTEEELYRRFTQQVQRNLHVVFTMNPANNEFSSRASTSPALFNRCVIDWFGTWSDTALQQVGADFTKNMDIETSAGVSASSGGFTMKESLVSSIVYMHQTMDATSKRVGIKTGQTNYITPRHYLDAINQLLKLYKEKRAEVEEQQIHLNLGLAKLRETEDQVKQMQASLAIKETELKAASEKADAKLQQILTGQVLIP